MEDKRVIFISLDENSVVQGWGSTRGMESEFAFEIDRNHSFFSTPPFYWIYENNELHMSSDLMIDEARSEKLAELNADCNASILAGFLHEGDFFEFGDKDQTNFNQQLSLLILDPAITSVTWKTLNNGIKVFTREQFIEACKAGERHKRNNIGRYWQLKEYVLKTPFSSSEEIEEISFSSFQIPTGG